MYGRYGNDQLNIAILVVNIILCFTGMFVTGYVSAIFMLLQFMLLVWWMLRAFSKNIYKRRRENEVFLRFWNPFKKRFRGVGNFFSRLKDRKHKYFKCPLCKSRLRVPRGRGSITVTCPRCKHRFDAKS